jgi:hypothetical protein
MLDSEDTSELKADTYLDGPLTLMIAPGPISLRGGDANELAAVIDKIVVRAKKNRRVKLIRTPREMLAEFLDENVLQRLNILTAIL